MEKLFFAIVFFALAGCKTAPPAPISVPARLVDVHSEYQKITLPSVGTTITKGIGEELIHQGDAKTGNAILVAEEFYIGTRRVMRGEYDEVAGTSEYRRFVVGNIQDGGKKARDFYLIVFKKDVDKKVLCVTVNTCAEANYSLGKITKYSTSINQQTLIYSGKIGNRITLGYREFSDGTARPAFNNDVAYDLSESRILGYKGARLEVVKATNTEITYKVLAGFN